MNERIREFALQAGFSSWVLNPSKETMSDTPELLKKFDELIVQDINNTILHTARWHQEVEKDDNTVMALCDLVKDIREEYGVE